MYNVTDIHFMCLCHDCLLIDNANDMMENRCVLGGKDFFVLLIYRYFYWGRKTEKEKLLLVGQAHTCKNEKCHCTS